MHIDLPQVQNETLFAWRIYSHLQRINNSRGGWSRSKIAPDANISLIEFLTNSQLFIADFLLLNLAVSRVSRNGSLYPSCIILIIFKVVSFALIIFFQKPWFYFKSPLTGKYFSGFVNLNSLFLRLGNQSLILESKELYETLPSNSVCFVVL